MSDELLRIYSAMDDRYPVQWDHTTFNDAGERLPPIKLYVRELAGHRCVRCGHPYPPGIAEDHPRGEWTPCDVYCTHGEPTRTESDDYQGTATGVRVWLEAQWRILTVHHLNGVKWDCRWWNLVALCQRCHLTIQGKVNMDREFAREHSEWFKPYAAGWYAVKYLGRELTREETMAELDELLMLEQTWDALPGMDDRSDRYTS